MAKQIAVPALSLFYLACVVISNIGLKLSAASANWRGFLAWQAVGNLTGFMGVLAFTLLLKLIPLHLAYGITAGFGFVLVQVVAARLFFHERITPVQWAGVALVSLGILLIASGRR
ncbi:MAG: hypothetical protein DRI61_05445 [Chloroflexi bacterium]|nr:MAG: hypothetical protein DRI61_05445 [Chloroflexota bacterium]HDN80944.1 hypothetical protein [Chloroflexota bacterium]